MKRIRRNFKSLPGWAACAATCVCGTALAQDTPANAMKEENAPKLDEPAEEPAKTEADYRNWFDVSVGGNLVKGNKASFSERHQLPRDFYGGVESFHYEQDIAKKGLLEIDGRGIFDNEDYELKINLEHPDYGFVRGGYREFQTWYDASGIYLPSTDLFVESIDDEFTLNRGELWFETGLRMPNVPELTFRYSHQFRDGGKSSTIYGDTGFGGVTPQRGIVPGFYDIDEERDIFELEGKHTLKNTEVGLALRYEMSDQNNTRNVRRRPFELTQDRYLTQRDEIETDLFNVRASSETWLNDNMFFTTGYSFTTMDTDLGGSRIYGADYDAVYDPLFGRRQGRDEGFLDLVGGSKLEQHVANINLMITPAEHLTIVPSLRFENQDQKGVSQFLETNVGTDAALTPSQEALENTSDRGILDVSEGLEVRYTGLTNWVLYARGEWLQGEGDVSERQTDLLEGRVDISRDTDSTRFTQKYVVGANWYPMARMNLAAQYYYKTRENEYDHPLDQAPNNAGGNRYPAYIVDQNFKTHDVNFRVTVRPGSQLTLVSRYDFQVTTFNNQMDFLSEVESAESITHIFGQTVTWVPLSRLYLQGSLNYVIDRTDSDPVANLNPAGGVLQRSENDYINATAMAGFVLSDKDDLQAQYFFYKANNYTDNSSVGVPFNSGAEEHGVTTSLIHRFTAAMQWTIKYGFYTATDQLSGGRDDYEAHMVYSSYRFLF